MKSTIITAFAAFMGFTAQAQQKETRAAENATGIEVKKGIEVVFTQSETPSLTVEASSRELLDNVATEYKKGILKIYFKNDEANTLANANTVKVYVSENEITNFNLSNGSLLKLNGKVKAENLDIRLSGGATLIGELEVNGTCSVKAATGSGFRGVLHGGTLTADVLGGSFIRATGSVNDVKLYVSNASVQVGKLLCTKADVQAQQNSVVFVNADNYIKAEADGTSTVTYYGEPKTTITGTNTYSIQRDTQKLTLNK
ncbi:GIN domain-containing protein [Flavobacterium sp. RHBU_3]|uniref:GIN domain-containing protein n=1 Tax=Flavobacterium sp. RHBU_3 TaxID=3391184 RepID=UPI003984C9CD